jgi:hypothetical protein
MQNSYSTANFTSSYGKRIELKLKQDKSGDISILHFSINEKEYKVRTAVREQIILAIAEKYISLEEQFIPMEKESIHFENYENDYH